MQKGISRVVDNSIAVVVSIVVLFLVLLCLSNIQYTIGVRQLLDHNNKVFTTMSKEDTYGIRRLDFTRDNIIAYYRQSGVEYKKSVSYDNIVVADKIEIEYLTKISEDYYILVPLELGFSCGSIEYSNMMLSILCTVLVLILCVRCYIITDRWYKRIYMFILITVTVFSVMISNGVVLYYFREYAKYIY